jgi:WD40 repeat protein
VAFSPDGRRVISGTGSYLPVGNYEPFSKTFKVWDAISGQETLTFQGQNAAFSPDGQLIASCVDDFTIKLWDARSGREVLEIGGKSGVTSVAFSLDGPRIATGTKNNKAVVWDARSGQEDLSFGWHPSVVSHADAILSRTALARRTFSRMSWALAVQTNGSGWSLCSSM